MELRLVKKIIINNIRIWRIFFVLEYRYFLINCFEIVLFDVDKFELE